MWNIVTFSVSILAFIARQPRMILVDWIKHFDLLSTEMPVPVARLNKTVICRKIRLSCFRWDIQTVLYRVWLLTRSYHLSLAVLLAVIKDKTPQQFLYLLSCTLYFARGQSKSPRHLCQTMDGTGNWNYLSSIESSLPQIQSVAPRPKHQQPKHTYVAPWLYYTLMLLSFIIWWKFRIKSCNLTKRQSKFPTNGSNVFEVAKRL